MIKFEGSTKQTVKNNKTFLFRDELKRYCRQDIKMLMFACETLKERLMTLKINYRTILGWDP